MRGPLVAMLAGALAALVLWKATPDPDDRSGMAIATSLRADAREAPPTPSAAPPAAAGAPAQVVRAIERALDRHVESAGLAERLRPSDRAALRDALIEARRASTRARRRSHDPAWQAEQSRALVAADRVFRDTLGTGLSEFMAEAGPPGRVEDLGRRPPS